MKTSPLSSPPALGPAATDAAGNGGADGPAVILVSTRFSRWVRLLACVGGGAFMALAFPPVDWSGIVWVGLLPLLTVLWVENAGFWRNFRAGWLYGMGMYCVGFSWIMEVGQTFCIPRPVFLAVAFLPLMSLYSLLPALWAGVAGTLLRPATAPLPDCADLPQEQRKYLWSKWAMQDILSTLRCAVGAAALWACIDWMRGQGTLGFSWNTLGLALYDGLSLVQWAEYTGAAALSFIPVFASVILWRAFRRIYLYFKGTGTTSGCRPLDFYAAVIFLFILFAGGVWMSQENSPTALFRKESVMKLPVMSVQLNQNQRERVLEGRGGAVQDGMYLRETMSAFHAVQQEMMERAHRHPELGIIQQLPVWVVWPESATGYPFNLIDGTGQRLQDRYNNASLFGESGLPLLRKLVGEMGGQPFVLFTGIDEQLWMPDAERNLLIPEGMMNSMAVIPNGSYEGMLTASKQHLMPFGEYLPLAQDIKWIGEAYTKITGTQVGEGIRPGTGSEPLMVPVPGTEESIGVIPAICYEDTVGFKLPKFVRMGPQVIVNISNDGWFNVSACGEQQARNAALRCIELRRPMVRAANMGVCCSIAPNGAPIDELRKADGSPHLPGYSYALLPVDKAAGLTCYARFGDWAIALCALLALAAAGRGLRQAKAEKSGEQSPASA